MRANTRQAMGREWRYFRKYALAKLLSWDVRVGLVVGLAVALGFYFAKHTRNGPHLLEVAIGMSLAMLAIVIGAISILTVFLTEQYSLMLRVSFKGDTGEVFYPYRLIACVSCLDATLSLVGLFVWPVATPGVKAALIGVSVGLAAWGAVGTLQLVNITAGHGKMRMRMQELREGALEELEAKLKAAGDWISD